MRQKQAQREGQQLAHQKLGQKDRIYTNNRKSWAHLKIPIFPSQL
jgi:hypothetical protein